MQEARTRRCGRTSVPKPTHRVSLQLLRCRNRHLVGEGAAIATLGASLDRSLAGSTLPLAAAAYDHGLGAITGTCALDIEAVDAVFAECAVEVEVGDAAFGREQAQAHALAEHEAELAWLDGKDGGRFV